MKKMLALMMLCCAVSSISGWRWRNGGDEQQANQPNPAAHQRWVEAIVAVQNERAQAQQPVGANGGLDAENLANQVMAKLQQWGDDTLEILQGIDRETIIGFCENFIEILPTDLSMVQIVTVLGCSWGLHAAIEIVEELPIIGQMATWVKLPVTQVVGFIGVTAAATLCLKLYLMAFPRGNNPGNNNG